MGYTQNSSCPVYRVVPNILANILDYRVVPNILANILDYRLRKVRYNNLSIFSISYV